MRRPSVRDISEVDLNALLASLKSKGAARLKRPSTLALSLAATIGASRVSAAAKELDAESYDALANLEVVDDLTAFDVACLPGEKYSDGEPHDHEDLFAAVHSKHGPHYLNDPFASRFESPYARHQQDHDGHDVRAHAMREGTHDAHDGAAGHSAAGDHHSHGAHEGHDAAGGGHEHAEAEHGNTDHGALHDAVGQLFHHAAHDAHAAHGAAGHDGRHEHHISDHGGHVTHQPDMTPVLEEEEQGATHDPGDDHGHDHVAEGTDATAPEHAYELDHEETPDAPQDHHHHHHATLAAMETPPLEDLSGVTAPII